MGKWTSPISNRLLAEAAGAAYVEGVNTNIAQPGVIYDRGTPEWYAKAARLDFIRGTLTTATGSVPTDTGAAVYPFAAAVSYVTGTHALKTGIQGRRGWISALRYNGNADLTQRYRDGRPDTVDVQAAPSETQSSFGEFAVYVQDVWSYRRLTVTPGLRLEHFSGSIDRTSMPAGRFVPAREVEAFDPVPDWLDLAPRLSAVYDLFGDAKTAVKGSAHKYMARVGADFPGRYNPIGATSDRRNWFDCDLVPGSASACSGRVVPTNGDDIAQDSEIGPSSNNLFGLAPPRRADADVRNEYQLGLLLERPARAASSSRCQRIHLPHPLLQPAGRFERSPDARRLCPVPGGQPDGRRGDYRVQPQAREAGRVRHRGSDIERQRPEVFWLRGRSRSQVTEGRSGPGWLDDGEAALHDLRDREPERVPLLRSDRRPCFKSSAASPLNRSAMNSSWPPRTRSRGSWKQACRS